MRNPVWILNLGLLFILLAILIVMVLMWRRPAIYPIRMVSSKPTVNKKDIASIDISQIYENDLFRTYVKPFIPVKPPHVVIDVPPVPSVLTLSPEKPPEAKFLEPLKVVLTGVIVATNERDNRAIIVDERTAHEKLYAMGDTIEDAEIIKIERKYVIFMRSNGAQEIVFLNPAAAAADPIFNAYSQDLKDIVVKKEPLQFVIDPEKFSFYVTSLAHFIDMLDLVSMFDDARVGIGVRVGVLASQSLGIMLGLEEGDIITHINDHMLNNTESRVLAYNEAKDLPVGSTVTVKLKRHEKELVYTYSLQKLNTHEVVNYVGDV